MSLKPQVNLEEAEWWLTEDMPESQPHVDLSDYAKHVLGQLYISEGWFITGNVAIFPPQKIYAFSYLAPDVVLFKGAIISATERATITSWQMSRPDRPAPTVVFEISSKETWQQDLDPKPTYYQQLGAKEYFACDPQGFWSASSMRLRGWNYAKGSVEEIQPDSRGWLWSEELNSWLGWDGLYLRFYDLHGSMRLTGEETKDAVAQTALKQVDIERTNYQVLLEKLRKHNIDPDAL